MSSNKFNILFNLYALVYVNAYDILVIGFSSKMVHDLVNKLHDKFSLKKLGKPAYILDIEVTYLANG